MEVTLAVYSKLRAVSLTKLDNVRAKVSPPARDIGLRSFGGKVSKVK